MVKQIKNKKSNSLLYGIICFLITICLSEIIFLYFSYSNKNNNVVEFIPPLHNLLPTPSGKIEPEITKIKQSGDFSKKVILYKQLINRVGPVNAQNDLYLSGITFDGSAHLLNHTVGEWLYDHYKSKGIIYCKDYFLSACYHGVVISAISQDGFSELSKIMQECLPFGAVVNMQCAHAIGHGLLAFDGYKNLTQALADCDTVSTQSKNFPSYNCYDGVFMENVFGVHLGYPSPNRWINKNDPQYPCDDPLINVKYINACWLDQPYAMFQLFNNDFTRVGQECLKLTNKDYQLNCFDAISRQITPFAKGDINKTFAYCNLMPKNWVWSCITSNANSYLSQGDQVLPFTLCGKIPEQQQSCYAKLADQIETMTPAHSPERENLCRKITDVSIQKQCFGS